MERVLLVDDCAEARAAARGALEPAGLEVTEAADGEAALRQAMEAPVDLMLLELTVPVVGGYEVLRRLRETTSLPVIVLSRMGSEDDRVRAFELGADDYVVKPFLQRELPARVRSVVRRARAVPAPAGRLRFGDRLEVRLLEHQVVVDGRLVAMAPVEFRLLARMASEPGRAFSRAELLHDVWGPADDWRDTATVTEHVRRLRRKIEPDPSRPCWLRTAKGMGYCFDVWERSGDPDGLEGLGQGAGVGVVDQLEGAARAG